MQILLSTTAKCIKNTYKSSIRPHYSDINFDQAYKYSFRQKIESILYNAITGAIGRTSRNKLDQELSLKTLSFLCR